MVHLLDIMEEENYIININYLINTDNNNNNNNINYSSVERVI